MLIPACPVCENIRPYCIHKSYPLPKVYHIEKQVEEKLKREFFGPSVSVFVGHNFYPNVYVGPMAALENSISDSPSSWFGMDYSKLIEMRAFLLRSKQKENIYSNSRFIQTNQELALSEKPTDTEIKFKKKPYFQFSFSEYTQPMGPAGTLEKMRLTENTKIRPKVEKIVNDDLKAADAAYLLYQSKHDVYKIMTILSSGVLGLGKKRKLVPTRWGIVAVYNIIAKSLIDKIKDYVILNEYRVYQSNYLDNHYTILLIPGSWEFENFEVWAPGSNWSAPTQARIIEEYEPYEGRTDYAKKQAGGYYASKIGGIQLLDFIRKQAKVIVFREVGEGYSIPIGSWQILESIKHAFTQPHKKFSSQKEALEYLKIRLRVDVDNYVKNSKILNRRTIMDFV